MKSYLQLLGAGSRESGSHSIYYFLDHYRWLINVSEGTQRMTTQHGLKISPSKLATILVTRLDWECLGGLPGLILTMADSSENLKNHPDANKLKSCRESTLRIIGPRHLKHAIAAMRPFLHRHNFTVEIEELVASHVDDRIVHFHDSRTGVNCWSLEIATEQAFEGGGAEPTLKRPSLVVENLIDESEEPHHFLLSMFKSEYTVGRSDDPEGQACLRRNRAARRLARDVVYATRTMAVVLQGPTRPGKLDMAAAKAAGVPAGPLIGKLSRGEKVTLHDGRVVQPEICVGVKRPCSAILLLDIPTMDLLECGLAQLIDIHALCERPVDGRIEGVIHLLGAGVDVVKYRMTMVKGLSDKFPWLQHFFSLPNSSLLFPSSVQLQHRLAEDLGAQKYFVSGVDGGVKDGAMKPLGKISVFPEASLDESECITDMNRLMDAAASSAGGEIVITALGTGAAIPGKYRNVSSTLIETPEGNLFFDSGEGTLGQVYRLFGNVEVAEHVLSKTRIILLSHMHGDHHLGAISLLKSITTLSSEPLYLVAPERFRMWFDEMSQVSEFGWNEDRVRFVSCDDVKGTEKADSTPLLPFKVTAIDVDHCFDAFGYSVVFASGEKFVYSGDTRPCDNLIMHAQRCSLLIHEATLSDDLMHEAILRKHSTISEAIAVGLLSQSEKILLTHFSQRYAKGSLRIAEEMAGRVALAVDLLRIPLKEFEVVARLTARLPDLLPVDEEVVDE